MGGVVASLLAVCLPGTAAAEVAAKGSTGFTVVHELRLEATPERAYQALTAEVASWWDPSHSYSHDAGNFTMDARAGGCFCERLPNGGSVEHMRVVFAAPGKRLRLMGGLGPLQGIGASGPMDFELAPNGDATRLTFRYTVSGFAPDGLDAMAEPVDGVLRGQLTRLAAYLRTGDPARSDA
ncbi:MAG TPA: SRPBCC domain-containing protein [Pseudomonadales bacterium]